MISWIVTHTSSCSLSTCIVRAACARLGATSSRRGATVGSSRARSYWPSTRWESMPAIAPTCAPISSPPAAPSASYSGPRSCPGRFQLKRMRRRGAASGPAPAGQRLEHRAHRLQVGGDPAGAIDRFERGQLARGAQARSTRSHGGRTAAPAAARLSPSDPRGRALSPGRPGDQLPHALRGAPVDGVHTWRVEAALAISSWSGALLARRSTGRALARRGHRASRPRPPDGAAAGTGARRERAELLQRAEVRDVLAWMRLLVDPRDAAAAVRALARPPIELRQVDLARVIQMVRRQRLDVVAALAGAMESPQLPPRGARADRALPGTAPLGVGRARHRCGPTCSWDA